MKNKILFVADNSTQLDSFIESQALDKIKKKYNIFFLISRVKNDYRKPLLEKFGKILPVKFIPSEKRNLLNKINYFVNEIIHNKIYIKKKFLYLKSYKNQSDKIKKIVKFIFF